MRFLASLLLVASLQSATLDFQNATGLGLAPPPVQIQVRFATGVPAQLSIAPVSITGFIEGFYELRLQAPNVAGTHSVVAYSSGNDPVYLSASPPVSLTVR